MAYKPNHSIGIRYRFTFYFKGPDGDEYLGDHVVHEPHPLDHKGITQLLNRVRNDFYPSRKLGQIKVVFEGVDLP